MPPPKRKLNYAFYEFKARLVANAQPFTIGECYCGSLKEAFELKRLTWKKPWVLIPNGKHL